MGLEAKEIQKINAMPTAEAVAYVDRQIARRTHILQGAGKKAYERFRATLPSAEELAFAEQEKGRIEGLLEQDPALLERQQEYYDMMTADSTLSPEEEAMFEEEFNLQVET